MERYTIEEFKEMYRKAQIEAVTQLQKEMEQADTEKEADAVFMMTFSLQNIMCLTKMYNILFKEQ